jgi:hypothetical protein
VCLLPFDLTCNQPGERKRGNREREASQHHYDSGREVVEDGVGIQASESLSVVSETEANA